MSCSDYGIIPPVTLDTLLDIGQVLEIDASGECETEDCKTFSRWSKV